MSVDDGRPPAPQTPFAASTRPGHPASLPSDAMPLPRVTAAAALAVVGATTATGAELAAGRVGPPPWAFTFTDWAGAWSRAGISPVLTPWPGRVLAVSLLVLVGCFVLLVELVRRGELGARAVAAIGTAWAVPVTLGPPMLSNDVYSYVAQGAVAASGSDPARVAPVALGARSILLAAVDPRWRETVSPYGPLATGLQRGLASLAPGHPVVAVLAWRLVVLLSVVVIALCVRSLARLRVGDSRDDAVVLALTWANPLLLLHLLAAAHVDAVMVALLTLGVRAVVAGTPAGRALAAVLFASAGAVKLPALVALAVVVTAGPPLAHRARVAWAAGAAVLLAATWYVWSLLAGSGGDVLAAVRTPAEGRTLVAPGTLLADLLTPLRWAGLADGDQLLAAGRVVAALAGVAVLGILLATANRRSAATTVGLSLLTFALAAPVLYPWYLAWNVPLLAVGARGRNASRLAVVSAVGALLCVQGLTRAGTIVLVVVVVTGVAAWWAHVEGWTVRAFAALRPYVADPAQARR